MERLRRKNEKKEMEIKDGAFALIGNICVLSVLLELYYIFFIFWPNVKKAEKKIRYQLLLILFSFGVTW